MTTIALKLYSTTIGKKTVMAATGVILLGFVFVHMLGNLQVFAGSEKINSYAAFLQSMPKILWVARIIMLLAVSLHIITALQLIVINWKSRPISYSYKQHLEATYSSRTMQWTGPLLLAYVIYHLLDQTLGTVHPNFDHTNVYQNLVIGFSSVQVSVLYAIAMFCLGFHLKHGIWSMFQTLGLNVQRTDKSIRQLSMVVAIIIVVGYLSIPSAILAGFIK